MAKDNLKTLPDKPNSKEENRSVSWWQWFFLYPAFGVALISAVPDWADKLGELVASVTSPDHVKATELVRFMNKNPTCVASPITWVEVADQTKVDGTICDTTGDVWLRVQSKESAVYKGIDISELIRTNADAAGVFSVSAAYASATSDHDELESHSKNMSQQGVEIAQLAIVECQKFSGNKIFRFLRKGNRCFEETVDSNNGFVISKREVDCSQICR